MKATDKLVNKQIWNTLNITGEKNPETSKWAYKRYFQAITRLNRKAQYK